MALPKIGGKKLKNHISGFQTKAIRKEFENKYGFSTGDLVNALYGETAAVKKIAELGHDGRKILKNADLIRKNMEDAIQGTNEFNSILSEGYIQVAKGAGGIERQQAKVWLENMYLENGRLEDALKYTNAVELEAQTHKATMDYLTEQGVIAKSVAQTEADYRSEKLKMSLVEKQIKADEEYKDEQNRHMLTMGRNAIPYQLPRKKYDTVTVVHEAINKIKEFFMGF